MTTARLYWIEDDDRKFIPISRYAKLVRPSFRIVRVHSLQEWMDALMNESWFGPEPIKGVITDWSFPRYKGRGPTPIGDRVLDSLADTPIPAAVLSGDNAPVDFALDYPKVPWITSPNTEALRKWLVSL